MPLCKGASPILFLAKIILKDDDTVDPEEFSDGSNCNFGEANAQQHSLAGVFVQSFC